MSSSKWWLGKAHGNMENVYGDWKMKSWPHKNVLSGWTEGRCLKWNSAV